MIPEEKILYHQIHPLKLITDFAAAVVALALFWQRHLVGGLAAALLPPLAVSYVLLRTADLERYKASAFGRYVRANMTRGVETLRLAGFAVMSVGAWGHAWPLILLGALAILFGWLRGVVFPRAT